MRAAAALAVAAAAVLAGCGDDDGDGGAPPAPTGPLAEALAEVGGSGEHGSLGVGWTEPRLAKERGIHREAIADALAPNAATVVESAAALRRRWGLDPLTAERLVSVGGSFAYGLRLDGADGSRLADELADPGDRVRRAGGVELVNVGGYAQVPEPLLDAGILGLGARDAFGPSFTVLATSARARASLLGNGEPLVDVPVYRAAADCLGDVAAARMIPDKHLLSTEVGVELMAMGVADPRHEVLCVVGGTGERAEETAAALEESFARGAREPRTGDAMDEIVEAAEVTSDPFGETEVVRAELTLAPGEPPGYLFGTVALGSLAELTIQG